MHCKRHSSALGISGRWQSQTAESPAESDTQRAESGAESEGQSQTPRGRDDPGRHPDSGPIADFEKVNGRVRGQSQTPRGRDDPGRHPDSGPIADFEKVNGGVPWIPA
jgi:hypothetical protein